MTCSKLGYTTKREAKRALASAQEAAAAGYTHRDERRTYRCRCGQYHLTSTPHRRFDPEAYAAMLEGVAA